MTTAVYLINRLPTPVLGFQSPFSKLLNNRPDYQKLKSFGCLCFPWLKPYTNHKLAPRSIMCVFVGYSADQHAYQCLDPTTNRIYTSRHVRFLESEYPFRSLAPQAQPHPPADPEVSVFGVPILQSSHGPTTTNTTETSTNISTTPTTTNYVPSSPHPSLSPTDQLTQSANPLSQPTTSHSSQPTSSSPTPQRPLHAPTTMPCSSHGYLPTHTPPSLPAPPITRHPNLDTDRGIVTRSKNNIVKPITKFTLVATVTPSLEPRTITQALKTPEWRTAMQQEYDALQSNHTWELVPSSSQQNLVGCKWVYRVKHRPDGSIDRYKARLVAKGFHQRPGWDYTDTFSPVVKPVTVRIVLTLAVHHGWSLKQLDINNAFLQGTLHEEVYMSQPPGFVHKDFPTHVCKLKKAIYGLKQAPRAWYNELRGFLLALGFSNSVADTSLFIYRRGLTTLYLLVYVDDIIVTGNEPPAVEKLIKVLACKFSLKDLGDLSYFLGVEVHKTVNGVFLSQRKYIQDLLLRAGMEDAKPVSTPISATSPLLRDGGEALPSPTDYRTLVGSLQYLSLTRPDVAFCVSKLSQFMQQPADAHWHALKRVLRYLAGTIDCGINISASAPLVLHAYSDADWAGDKDDCVSTTGYLLFLGGAPISWSSRKQRSVARSSTEAEYKALADTAAELMWVLNLFVELGHKQNLVPVVYCDNLGATSLSSNPVFHSRIKHIALAYHFVREQVQRGTFRVSFVSTDDQLADVLTKPLLRPRFDTLISKLDLSRRPINLRGNDKNNI